MQAPDEKPRRVRHPKPTAEQNMGRLVRKAAQIIEDKGWIQGTLGTDETGFCIDGALQRVVGVRIGTKYSVSMSALHNVNQAHNELAKFLHPGCRSVWSWNDEEGRTKDEVLLHMRKFADEKDPQRP